ncbi:aspartyl-phosphate phosphatase Spo0E family protein [Anaerobacillus sp. HL2]|nr:aspartyl-phosphate phosphatase Spo0E family protein [Anaerobacillus sp. HL2]
MPSLINQIEKKKKEMVDLADKHGLSSNETIR